MDTHMMLDLLRIPHLKSKTNTNHMCSGEKQNTTDWFGKNAPAYHVYPVSGATSEERAERSRGWGWGWGAKGFF